MLGTAGNFCCLGFLIVLVGVPLLSDDAAEATARLDFPAGGEPPDADDADFFEDDDDDDDDEKRRGDAMLAEGDIDAQTSGRAARLRECKAAAETTARRTVVSIASYRQRRKDERVLKEPRGWDESCVTRRQSGAVRKNLALAARPAVESER